MTRKTARWAYLQNTTEGHNKHYFIGLCITSDAETGEEIASVYTAWGAINKALMEKTNVVGGELPYANTIFDEVLESKKRRGYKVVPLPAKVTPPKWWQATASSNVGKVGAPFSTNPVEDINTIPPPPVKPEGPASKVKPRFSFMKG